MLGPNSANPAAQVQGHPKSRHGKAEAIESPRWFMSYGLFILNVIFLSVTFGIAQKTNPVGKG